MTNWKPGDPLYDQENGESVEIVNDLFEFKSCNPDSPDIYWAKARWTPCLGWCRPDPNDCWPRHA